MFADTDIAKDILSKRYYRPGETSPEQLLHRVAKFIASAEGPEYADYWGGEFFDIMHQGKFLPNSPCLVNAGAVNSGLFACFVIGMEDDLKSITAAKADAMAITKAGGGWGIGLSSLRPMGWPVKGSTHGIAGGPIGFWETFSSDMKTMTQGGFRDAACMATMDINHPDALNFIRSKSPQNSVKRLLNLNLLEKDAQKIDAVATALLRNSDIRVAAETYMHNFNISVLVPDSFMMGGEYRTQFDGKEVGLHAITNSQVMREIASGMWGNGEPGILFIDKIRERTRYNPSEISATNPCGEQPLPPNGSCCLGSMNLSEFVRGRDFAWDEFRNTVGTAVRFLDNMITLNTFPTKKTAEWSLYHRSIGLGIMGFADALVKMGIYYDSDEAIEFASMVASEMLRAAENKSVELGDEKGHAVWNGRRNHVLLSIAPTGSISLLAGCSAGIEPIFGKKIIRKDQTGVHEIEHELSGDATFVTVADLHWSAVIDIVAEFSKYIDSSISYTVNMPKESTVDDVLMAIRKAWTSGCNGITVYRDGSRQVQVLNSPTAETLGNVQDSIKRPHTLAGTTFKYTGQIDGESTNLYVTVNELDGNPWEVFVHTPHIQSMPELQLVTAVTRLSSLSLKYGAPVHKIIEQLKRIEGQSITSVPAIIARALSELHDYVGKCNECGGRVEYSGGCSVCVECGFSHCG